MSKSIRKKSGNKGSGIFLIIIFLYFGGFSILETSFDQFVQSSNAIVYGKAYKVEVREGKEIQNFSVVFENSDEQTMLLQKKSSFIDSLEIRNDYGETTMFYESKTGDFFLINDFYMLDLAMDLAKILFSLFILASILRSILRPFSTVSVQVLNFVYTKIICTILYINIFIMCAYLMSVTDGLSGTKYQYPVIIIMGVCGLSVLLKLINICKLIIARNKISKPKGDKVITSEVFEGEVTKGVAEPRSENLRELIIRKPTVFKHKTSRDL